MFKNNLILIVLAAALTLLLFNTVSTKIYNRSVEDLMSDKPASGETDKITIYDSNTGKYVTVEKITMSDAQWKEKLTARQYAVARKKATERPFTGKYNQHDESGIYRCAACGTELFASTEKFNSACGWPSFSKPIAKSNIKYEEDTSHNMTRTEVLCPRCDAHLGHVFNDGPAPAGLRYCINSVSLEFGPGRKTTADQVAADHSAPRLAAFGAGCFWGVQAAFDRLPGVLSTTVGYMGGTMDNPSYREVCSGRTGHAEVVRVEYDPVRISYPQLLETFWKIHDPTTLNRQGPDIGSQYRSVIFVYNEEQQQQAQDAKKTLDASNTYKRKTVTEIVPAPTFYPAEDYHQDYLKKKGLPSCGIG